MMERLLNNAHPGVDLNEWIKVPSVAAKFITNITLISLPFLRAGIAVSGHYMLAGYHDDLFKQLDIFCPENIYSAVAKRKAEYLAGRYISRLTLLVHGLTPINILSGTHRQPLWPAGWIGSITHTHDTVISCLASLSQISLLGIDLENWITANHAKEIAEKILDRKEERVWLPLEPYQRRVTLAFSAKESFFKALYPIVGHYFAFDTVSLVDCELKASSFTLQLKKTLCSSFREGNLFFGHFSMNEKGVLTFVVRTTAY